LYEVGDTPMTTWTSDELNRIGTAEELQIASLRYAASIWSLNRGKLLCAQL